ncbi:hypothetical protein [Sphingomonas sp.]|uniref:hypothetical protein n=1 Tax=Sphingomonas sp. TaxID=28214 RepID=UPI003B007611
MNLRYVDWIWHVTGSMALAPGQTHEEAFDSLEPLFRVAGTSHERTVDALTFRKKDQAAQDKMSVFDRGTLRIESGPNGPVLRYRLFSRALLFCFLMPFMFLAIAQFTVELGRLSKPESAAKKADVKKPDVPLNPIDKALGAPEPDSSKKDPDKPGRDKKPKPTSAYVFAGGFAVLYIFGRILEDRLIRRLLKREVIRPRPHNLSI